MTSSLIDYHLFLFFSFILKRGGVIFSLQFVSVCVCVCACVYVCVSVSVSVSVSLSVSVYLSVCPALLNKISAKRMNVALSCWGPCYRPNTNVWRRKS